MGPTKPYLAVPVTHSCQRGDDPWGIKDPRIRALVEQAIVSGNSSQAGIAALPGSLMLELRWLVWNVQREIECVRQPTLVVHPRNDDRASLRNLDYLQSHLGGLTSTVILDDSYHPVTIDRQRRLLLNRTLEFASQLDQKTTISEGISDLLAALKGNEQTSNSLA